MNGSIEVGQVLLGKYRVESVLGQGGMGIVVAARHVELGKRVAIKMLLPQAMEYPGACERFVREARSAARLEAEHIAQVHDTGTLEDGTPYILMEYLDGQDLKKVVRERGALPPGEAALYVIQACEAVAEAHKHGIVHRDLKPANMMLVRRASGASSIKVLDFGISKNLDPAARTQDLTQSGMIMCSPSYMAPEQVSHPKEVDPRSDIWALGVVLYELVTGMLPFYADSGMELLAQVLQKQPQRPVDLVPGLSGELEGVILKCMAKDRDKRFQSVVELTDALRPFVALERVPEASRKLRIAEIDVPCPDSFDPTDKTISDTRTRVLSVKGVGATLKLPEATRDETRTRVLPKTFAGKTVKLPERADTDTPKTVSTDKPFDDVGLVPEEQEQEWQPPMRRSRGGVVVGAILTLAVVLGGAAVHARRISPIQAKNDAFIVTEGTPTPRSTDAPTSILEPSAAPATIHNEPKVMGEPALPNHSSALATPAPNSANTQRATPTGLMPTSAAQASVNPEPRTESAPAASANAAPPPAADDHADSAKPKSQNSEGQGTSAQPTPTATAQKVDKFDD